MSEDQQFAPEGSEATVGTVGVQADVIAPPFSATPPLEIPETPFDGSPVTLEPPEPQFDAPDASFGASSTIAPPMHSSVNFYTPAPEVTEIPDEPVSATSEVQAVADAITAEVHKAVVGQDEAIELAVAGLLADGHVLLEGVPGTAKTLLVRALAAAISSDFKRIQFTPDLMPSDITGTRIFDQRVMEFTFNPGPIFTGLLLADEINRTPPKTQAALLEAMQEHRVTIDGETHELPNVFMVFATSNPIEFEGTYPLPEAQLDRFLLKVLLGYPSPEAEQTVLRRRHAGFDSNDLTTAGMTAVVDVATIEKCRKIIDTVRVEDAMFRYISELVGATRNHRQLVLGASPRASLALLQVGKTVAAMRGRDFMIPDDVKSVAPAVLRHRLLLRPEAEIEGISADQIIEGILERLEVPR